MFDIRPGDLFIRNIGSRKNELFLLVISHHVTQKGGWGVPTPDWEVLEFDMCDEDGRFHFVHRTSESIFFFYDLFQRSIK